MTMDPLTIGELQALPAAVDLETAARALGLSRTFAYQLAKRDDFPSRVIRIGGTYRIPTADLLRLLGVTRKGPAGDGRRTGGTANDKREEDRTWP